MIKYLRRAIPNLLSIYLKYFLSPFDQVPALEPSICAPEFDCGEISWHIEGTDSKGKYEIFERKLLLRRLL
jgi:hypothetical protein